MRHKRGQKGLPLRTGLSNGFCRQKQRPHLLSSGLERSAPYKACQNSQMDYLFPVLNIFWPVDWAFPCAKPGFADSRNRLSWRMKVRKKVIAAQIRICKRRACQSLPATPASSQKNNIPGCPGLRQGIGRHSVVKDPEACFYARISGWW